MPFFMRQGIARVVAEVSVNAESLDVHQLINVGEKRQDVKEVKNIGVVNVETLVFVGKDLIKGNKPKLYKIIIYICLMHF